MQSLRDFQNGKNEPLFIRYHWREEREDGRGKEWSEDGRGKELVRRGEKGVGGVITMVKYSSKFILGGSTFISRRKFDLHRSPRIVFVVVKFLHSNHTLWTFLGQEG